MLYHPHKKHSCGLDAREVVFISLLVTGLGFFPFHGHYEILRVTNRTAFSRPRAL